MSIPDLPKDLVEEEILCRVPATHLKRVRSTCKRWNLLFNNRRFATKHFDLAAKELMVLMLTTESRICAVSVNLHGIVPSLEVKSELSLIDPRSNNSAQFDICGVFHCDGLLLFTSHDRSMLVVWNPCSGETRWIKAAGIQSDRFVLGYYQDSQSSSKSYKVLNFCTEITKRWEIYEFSSDSWRILDHDIVPGWYTSCGYSEHIVSLKGNTYWLATDKKETHRGVYLLGFDFTSEISSVLVLLPYKRSVFKISSLSIVREEKLSVLLQCEKNSKAEIWVTNKIDEEAKPVSWSKVLALDLSPNLQISSYGTFLLDEEKKVALCCERLIDTEDMNDPKDMDTIYCVGEDHKVTQVYLRLDTTETKDTTILNYVPSLVQIEPVGGHKRKRDH